MGNLIEKIIYFAKEKQQTDVNSHRGGYQTIIDYCKSLHADDVVTKRELLKAFCLHGGIQVLLPSKAKDIDELIEDFIETH